MGQCEGVEGREGVREEEGVDEAERMEEGEGVRGRERKWQWDREGEWRRQCAKEWRKKQERGVGAGAIRYWRARWHGGGLGGEEDEVGRSRWRGWREDEGWEPVHSTHW